MAQVILAPSKSRRIEYGHPWVYGNEVQDIKGKYQNGDIVEVFSHKKQFIGKGYINDQSLIMIRLLTRDPKDQLDKQFFFRRIQEAIRYRQLHGFADTYRVVFGEADFLPALVVDKFGGVLVLQTLSLGMDAFKPLIVEVLQELLQPQAIYERNDVPVRELEKLPQQTGFLTSPTDLSQGVLIQENGFTFNVDVLEGQKTGYFLDQTANRAAIAPFVRGKSVLDCFCHTGSFAVHAAGYGATDVTALDISEHAIQSAQKNAALNGLRNINFVTANAFDALKAWTAEKRQFDTVILDPPAFTKSRQTLPNALRGYKEINLRGMKLVKKGGFLITCTCSHFVTPELFRKTLQEAAQDAGVVIREVLYMPQGKDHPILWNVDETLYLKFYVLQVL